jgi:hypothetical protein
MNLFRAIILLLFWSSFAVAQEPEIRKCVDVPVYGMLDFWVGEWDVYSGEEKVGANRIEKVLNGCAVVEHWTAADGGEGKSLFYVDAEGVWQQVWVTEYSANPGGMKEKTHTATLPNDAVRFQGVLKQPKIGEYLDRTTLTPLDNGDVSQLIEILTDDGEAWQTTFHAVYRPVAVD